jgi:DNA-binding transcriptional ArsR family regulator
VEIMNVQKLRVRDIAAIIGIEAPSVLTFRPLGKEVKNEIIKCIQSLPPQTAVELDFIGVDICDVSFVDEIVLEVQSYLLKEVEDTIIFVSNISDGTIENLDAAIAVKDQKKGIRLQILQQRNGTLLYIGKLERNLDVTFNQLVEKRRITAREVAELNGIAINSASNRLKKLYDQRLVLREETIDSTGKQHVYLLP